LKRPRANANRSPATIYWLLSTFNPYVVTVMKTTLELQP
jgi:hypothetical protein